MTPRSLFVVAECPTLLEARPYGLRLDLAPLLALAQEESTPARPFTLVRAVALVRERDLTSGLLLLPDGITPRYVPGDCPEHCRTLLGWEIERALATSQEGDRLILATALPEIASLIYATEADGLYVTLVAPCIEALTNALLVADRFVSAASLYHA